MSESINFGGAMAEIHENDQEPKISWLDIELNGGKASGNGYQGTISAKELQIDSEQLKNYERLIEQCYVNVVPGAPDRCGDGRATILLPQKSDSTKWLSMLDEIKGQALGPQLFGGTFGEALPYRIATDNFALKQTAYEDFIDLVEALHAADIDFVPGSHSDEHASDSMIGCGKKDKHSLIIAKMANFGVRPILENQAGLIASEYIEPGAIEPTFKSVVAEIDEINLPENKARYLGTKGDEQQFKHQVFEAVKEINDKAAPQVKGKHKEAFVIINYVPGQTFNTNWFVNEVADQVQAFNVDFWRVAQRADALFSDNPAAKNRYIMTAAVDTIATAMVLTAGDQRVGVRK